MTTVGLQPPRLGTLMKRRRSSDASGGKSVSEKCQLMGGKGNCVRKHMLLQLHGLAKIRNPFEATTFQKTQYYVGVVKDKRTEKNGYEFSLVVRLSRL